MSYLRSTFVASLFMVAVACGGDDDDDGGDRVDANPGSEIMCGEGAHGVMCDGATELCRYRDTDGVGGACVALPDGCEPGGVSCGSCGNVCEAPQIMCQEGSEPGTLICTE
jgi:hypothetical protein